MSLVVPIRLLDIDIPDRRKAVLVVALSHRGDASIRQMKAILRCGQRVLLNELDALVDQGWIQRHRGRSSTFGLDRKSGKCNGRIISASAALAGRGYAAIPAHKYAAAASATDLWNRLVQASGYISNE